MGILFQREFLKLLQPFEVNSYMINKCSLKAVLNNSKKSLEWKFFEKDNISISFIPILEIEEFDGYVGLSSEIGRAHV